MSKRSPSHQDPFNSSVQEKLNEQQYKTFTLQNNSLYRRPNSRLTRVITSKQTKLESWKNAIDVFLIHYLLLWVYVIVLQISNYGETNLAKFAFTILLNIDTGLLNYFFLYISGGGSTYVLTGFYVSWNIALIYSAVKHRKNFISVYAKGIFFTYLLFVSVFFGIFSTALILLLLYTPMVFFNVLILLFLVILIFSIAMFVVMIIMSIPGFIIALLITSSKQITPLKPNKVMIPHYLVVPNQLLLNVRLNNKKNPELFCPYRFKDRAGCSFLGYETSPDFPLICDQPDTWQRCYVYFTISKSGEKITTKKKGVD